ncbi:PEP-CTERM/exosortase system-associated acyltransferase [Vreelandella sp. H-I2]
MTSNILCDNEDTIIKPLLPNIDPHQIDKSFKFIIANSPDEKKRAFLLRHQVFNDELNYNIGDNKNSTFEKDSHDQYSILCLLQHRESGMDVGCLRVVIISDTANGSTENLPLEEYCSESLTDPVLHPKNLPKNSICEVSRLAVHPLFRKKAKPPIDFKESKTKDSTSNNDLQNQSLISLSLFLSATSIVGLVQRKHVFAMLEPRFNRLLKCSGLHFQKVGNVINYCGERAAYYIDQHKAVENLPEQLIPLYSYINKDLSKQFHNLK